MGAWLTTPTSPSSYGHVFLWRKVSKAKSVKQAENDAYKTLVLATKRGLADSHIKATMEIGKEDKYSRKKTRFFINANKNSVITEINKKRKKGIKKAPTIIGNGKYYFSDNLRVLDFTYSPTKDKRSHFTVEAYQNISKYLSDDMYLYMPPRKYSTAVKRVLPYPVLFHKGKAYLFVVKK